MNRESVVSARGSSGLNSISMSGCVTSRPKLFPGGGEQECRFWVCDGREQRKAKFAVEAVARGELAVFLNESLGVGARVGLTGAMRAQVTEVAGGEILDYELEVFHGDPGDVVWGRSVERGGLNAYAMSGVVTKEPKMSGLPGRERSVFWMCDGDSREEATVRLPVYLAPGKVSELAADLLVGERLAVGGYLRSRKRFISGSPVYECQLVGCHVDGGFLVERGA